MAKARTADLRTVTDVLIHRDKKDVELPLALCLSFLGHFALLVFFTAFHGFGWWQGKGETINLGGGSAVTVTAIDLPSIGAPPTTFPEIDIPEPPAPLDVPMDEPAIDIPEPDAEIEFAPKPVEPEVEKPAPKPTPKPDAPKPKATKAPPSPKPVKEAAAPSRGTLSVGAGAGDGSGFGGGSGPPSDPGLAFYAQRVTSLIGEVWHQPYVNATTGTVLETVVYFAISRDGRTSDIAVERTSGIPNMDQSAMRAVMEAGRLPPLPPTFRGDELTVSFSFRFTAGQ